jgi:hypothetical protein
MSLLSTIAVLFAPNFTIGNTLPWIVALALLVVLFFKKRSRLSKKEKS